MPTSVTVRPNAVINGVSNGWTIFGGAGSQLAAVNDNNDATGIISKLNPGSTGNNPLFQWGAVSIPGGAVISQVQFFTRYSAPNGVENVDFDFDANVLVASTSPQQYAEEIPPTPQGSIANYAPVRATKPDGTAWVAGDFTANNINISVEQNFLFPAYQISVYDVWMVITYDSLPTATVTGPSGTISTTNQPNVTWTYSDPDSDPQTKYWAKVFTVADTGIGGFDPETFPAAWSSGDTASAATSVQVGVPLIANVAFKAYVKVGDGFRGYGAWAAGPSFTVTVSGSDKPGRAFFVPTNGSGTAGPGWYEFNSDLRESSFTWQSAPLRDPTGRSVEIREVQVYAKSYDANATIAVTVNGVVKTQVVGDKGIPGSDQLSFLFREHAENLDVTLVSTAGTAGNEAPTVQAVRIGWRPLHMAR